MINLIKCPRHLIDALDISLFEKVYDYKNGSYLKAGDQIIYFSEWSNLNALSVQINKMDLNLIQEGDKLQRYNFIIDKHCQIVDLNFPDALEVDISNKLCKIIEDKNPNTGLNGKDDSLLKNYDILDKLNPLTSPNNIIGRGLGLTPSGDDVLIGILFAMYYLNMKGQIEIFRSKSDLNRTNNISKEFLKYAYSGIFSESLLSLLDGEDLCEKIDHIMKTGHTSGSDTLLGIYYGFNNLTK